MTLNAGRSWDGQTKIDKYKILDMQIDLIIIGMGGGGGGWKFER